MRMYQNIESYPCSIFSSLVRFFQHSLFISSSVNTASCAVGAAADEDSIDDDVDACVVILL